MNKKNSFDEDSSELLWFTPAFRNDRKQRRENFWNKPPSFFRVIKPMPRLVLNQITIWFYWSKTLLYLTFVIQFGRYYDLLVIVVYLGG